VQRLEGHSGLTFPPDAQLLALASDDNWVNLWNPATGENVRVITVRYIYFSGDSLHLDTDVETSR
jgi:WD40 repeat protein